MDCSASGRLRPVGFARSVSLGLGFLEPARINCSTQCVSNGFSLLKINKIKQLLDHWLCGYRSINRAKKDKCSTNKCP
jgi:hypothetical protein